MGILQKISSPPAPNKSKTSNEMPTVPIPPKPIPPQDQYVVETANSGITGTNSEELSEASTSLDSQADFPMRLTIW